MQRTHELCPAAANRQTMRPTTPNLKIPRSVGPSSPPQTPRQLSPVLGPQKSSRERAPPLHTLPLHTMASAPSLTARTVGKGPNFSHAHARAARLEQLSPLSSSSGSDTESDSDADDAPLSPERAAPTPPPPPPRFRAGRTVINTALIIEELSDFSESDIERLDAIRPHAIEYAESEPSRSSSRNPPEVDQKITHRMGNLDCSDDSDLDISEVEYQQLLAKRREAKRHRRMTSGSIGKRTISESIGSDTDHEDLRAAFLGAEEVGSSARRLRRRVDNRRSLQFQDPPPERIDELEEPESESSEDEILISVALARELPYYEFVSMEIDSP